ncbi:MAG TPA: fibronectin type III domain-containing protein [Solirubrobacteraceae bacterium]
MRRFSSCLIVLGCLAAVPQVAGAATSPAVATGGASSVSASTATLKGTVNPEGRSTAYGFQYGTTKSYGTQTNNASAGSGTAAVKVSAKLSGLASGTVYHYRIVAVSSGGTSVGSDHTFKTKGSPAPQVFTGGTVLRSLNGATLTGFVNPVGAATTYRFQFGFSILYGLQTQPAALPATKTVQGVSFVVTGLQAHRIYHYRIVANSSGGTSVGQDQVFITGRARARGITRSTTPLRLQHRPFALNTHGRLQIPRGFPVPQSCAGRVRVRYFVGRRTLAVARVPLAFNCTYFATATIHGAVGAKHLHVSVRFLGNGLLTPRQGRGQTVRVG